MRHVAIVGGGPGGLLTAHLLERKLGLDCEATLFESSTRVGGKILTRTFDSARVLYEAGVAECYDYGGLGPDPLRSLVEELGLVRKPVGGGSVFLEGKLLRNEEEIRRHFGSVTLDAIAEFRRRSVSMLSVATWYADSWRDDNAHPWSRRTCDEILNEVDDPKARKYLQVTAHSDLATEPHLTSGLNGLKNFLMDVPGYVGQYSIEGGIERLPERLVKSLTATRVELETPVVGIEIAGGQRSSRYRVRFRKGRETMPREFDAVFVALPPGWLGMIEWRGETLRRAMSAHVAHYDRPAHYLRVSMLFERPFWRPRIAGLWFMLDAFGGTCVYDEGSRHDARGRGVLGFLLAGNPALSLGNFDEETLVDRVLESLPDELYDDAREELLEGRVHRWAGAVSAQPGGLPLRDPRSAHVPEPREHPGLFVVGDYLFDSTLNGVYDSANFATELMRLLPERAASRRELWVS
jgi:protoporphyrinogen oxidase